MMEMAGQLVCDRVIGGLGRKRDSAGGGGLQPAYDVLGTITDGRCRLAAHGGNRVAIKENGRC